MDDQQPNQSEQNQNNIPNDSPIQGQVKISQPKKDSKRSIITTIALFLLAPIIAILLTMFVFQSYEVEGPSMESTLQHQDRLIVNKMPVTWANITSNNYLPERGDIIVFEQRNSATAENQLIKRVIALPGERVLIRDGDITVYNDHNPDGFNPDTDQEHGDKVGNTTGNVDITVGDDEIFVLGDNRTNSLDSRAFGAVKQDDIVGTLVMRLWPFNNIETY